MAGHLFSPCEGCELTDAVCIPMLILLLLKRLPPGAVISCEPSPHSNWSIKARACDWAMKGKGETGGLRGEGERTEEKEEAMVHQNHKARRNDKQLIAGE